ncbi:MAG: hypothetical protein ACKOAO_09810 [Oxalobacteraceae bacterium]
MDGGTTLGGVVGATGAADDNGTGAECECWLEAQPVSPSKLINEIIKIPLAIFLDIGSLPEAGWLDLLDDALSDAPSFKINVKTISAFDKNLKKEIYIIYLLMKFLIDNRKQRRDGLTSLLSAPTRRLN